MKNINIGLIGLGNIGTGVVKLLAQNEELITRKLGAKLVLKKIADIDITTPRAVKLDKNQLTTDAKEIINDKDISIIKTLKESLVANKINSILGIMNGTSNFILTKMTDEDKKFDVVLKEAQALGFAEADPTFDVEGIDTAHKLAITLSLAYGEKVHLKDIYCEGITKIGNEDISFAKELGFRIKLLAIAIMKNYIVEARIHPTMIPSGHLLANVNQNYNAFHIVGDASGPVFLFGQGSGMMPTASAG